MKPLHTFVAQQRGRHTLYTALDTSHSTRYSLHRPLLLGVLAGVLVSALLALAEHLLGTPGVHPGYVSYNSNSSFYDRPLLNGPLINEPSGMSSSVYGRPLLNGPSTNDPLGSNTNASTSNTSLEKDPLYLLLRNSFQGNGNTPGVPLTYTALRGASEHSGDVLAGTLLGKQLLSSNPLAYILLTAEAAKKKNAGRQNAPAEPSAAAGNASAVGAGVGGAGAGVSGRGSAGHRAYSAPWSAVWGLSGAMATLNTVLERSALFYSAALATELEATVRSLRSPVDPSQAPLSAQERAQDVAEGHGTVSPQDSGRESPWSLAGRSTASAFGQKTGCTEGAEYLGALRRCVKLLGEYDRLASERQWSRRKGAGTEAITPLTSALTLVAAALQSTCGLSLADVERGSLDRARHRHGTASCAMAANTTVQARYAALTLEHIGREYPDSLSARVTEILQQNSTTSAGGGVPWATPWEGDEGGASLGAARLSARIGDRGSSLRAAWPVWRTGTGTQTGRAMKGPPDVGSESERGSGSESGGESGSGTGTGATPWSDGAGNGSRWAVFDDEDPNTAEWPTLGTPKQYRRGLEEATDTKGLRAPVMHEGVSGLWQYQQSSHAWPEVEENKATPGAPRQYRRGLEEAKVLPTPEDYEGVSRLRQYQRGRHVGPVLEEDEATVSIMIQFYKQPADMIQGVVYSAANCRHFRAGLGEGNSSRLFGERERKRGQWMELLVNVDQPAESGAWVKLWQEFRYEGVSSGSQNLGIVGSSGSGGRKSFMLVQFQHNVHEVEGYNQLSRMAKGQVLSLSQDDDLLPANCLWLDNNLRQLEAHDNVGLLGYNTALRRMNFLWWHMYVFDYLHSWHDIDPSTRSLASVVQWVDVGPMLCPRCIWYQMGGFDRAYGPLGQTGLPHDWHFSQGVWLRGTRVKHVFTEEMPKGRGAESATHKRGTRSEAFRKLNGDGVNGPLFFDVEVAPMRNFTTDEIRHSAMTVHPPDYIFGEKAELKSLIWN